MDFSPTVRHHIYTLFNFIYMEVLNLIKKENTRINVVIPKKIHKMLLEESEYEDRSVSNLVLKIIKEHYKIKEED